ncbi:DUF302 domain-containing protein [Rhodospira trueperi]|uniref:Uncharacterized conserved protein, DUF302 family n=1 Tax=Rhodospira trueperi TaxID=69960 RepID=A0A1G7GBL9_9PROT|nr:DUF302 domain-containing protein [Rhodospira trueperi]SDE85532.1 Uncharacterized conserved protein, DUF302 family [Rhodospira trueperi]
MTLTRRALAPLALAGALFASAAVSAPALAADENGLVRLRSPHSVEDTMARLKAAIEEKGITIFADINHGANAAAMDLEMPATHLLIFGSPKIGAPLMRANPAIGIDLPIKVVAWEDADGQTWLAYNDPAYLAERHGLPADMKPFRGMAMNLGTLTAKAVEE